MIAAACAAFVPQFLFISGAVSNDSAIVGLAALALWRLARTRRVAHTPREWFWIGAVCGFAALAKVSGLTLIVLASLVFLWHATPKFSIANFRFSIGAQSAIGNRKSEIIFSFFLFAFSFLLVSGWWYARNYFLYGEFTGTEMMLKIFGARAEPMTWELFAAQIAEVRETFWVGFGWGNIRAPSLAYTTFDFVSVVAGLGIAIGFARERAKRFLLIFFATWTLIVLAALIRWMFVTQAPHGRLFFPALPALAPLFVFGITQLVPPRWQMNLARASAAALCAFALFALAAILTPAYAFPNWSSARDAEKIPQRIEINYGDAMKLLGAEIVPRRVAPGAAITVTLFWQSLALMNDDYSIGLALLDANQRVLSNRASYPGHGLLPTRLWQSGQLLRDAYWLPIPREIAAPALAQLQVTLYSRATRRELIAQDAAGRTITPFVARVRIAPESVEVKPQHALNFIFDERIALIGYTITDARLTLYWQARAPIENDYTVFAHWLDANGNIVAQKDHTPANGAAPTALWEPGEIILDPFDLAAQNNYRVRVGLYRADTGARAEIRDANGNSIGDAVTLDLNEGK
ncbi:MAG: hypothetical protein HY070_08350 [Chloroflexi bacterium]|nr:hypothetical protein [Chloroflexota bacterium]